MNKYFKHPNLPKAKLITVRKSCVKEWFWRGHTVRIANAREFYLLGFNVTVRRPWLYHSARSLYPALINKGVADE